MGGEIAGLPDIRLERDAPNDSGDSRYEPVLRMPHQHTGAY